MREILELKMPGFARRGWRAASAASLCLVMLALAGLWAAPAWAHDDEDEDDGPPPLEEQLKTSRHQLDAGGRSMPYTAVAGNYVLRDEEGTDKASIFFVSYTADGVSDPADRPVTFAFNGGPGAAAVWVHLGAFGPKKVAMTEEGFPLPPPGFLVDNEYSVLPATDLVFIDPVSTGYSRPAPEQDPAQFHGYQEDIEWVGEFIRLWLTRNGRWASPKFLAGESYGTTRAAGLAPYLQEEFGLYLNGLVLLSTVLNWQNSEFDVGNDMPFLIYLPGYAATAHYHGRLPEDRQALSLEQLLREVEEFALGDYALALHQGDRLSEEREADIAARLARYTGLSESFVRASDLRIVAWRFLKELLRDEGKTAGRLDSRFTGLDRDQTSDAPEFDPSFTGVMVGYAALLNDYLRRDLGYETDLVYRPITGAVRPWSYADFENQYANMAESLRGAMTRNPSLRVLLAAGIYDFATPYFDAIYTVSHMGLPGELRRNVELELYEAGHMRYIREADHAKLRDDMTAFIEEASRASRSPRSPESPEP